jgi:hypothetical protein
MSAPGRRHPMDRRVSARQPRRERRRTRDVEDGAHERRRPHAVDLLRLSVPPVSVPTDRSASGSGSGVSRHQMRGVIADPEQRQTVQGGRRHAAHGRGFHRGLRRGVRQRALPFLDVRLAPFLRPRIAALPDAFELLPRDERANLVIGRSRLDQRSASEGVHPHMVPKTAPVALMPVSNSPERIGSCRTNTK